MILWIELAVLIAIISVFVGSTFVFRPEHVQHNPRRVRIGAAAQGLIIGVLVGFVLLPLRFAFFVPDPTLVPDAPPPPPKGVASLAIVPLFLILMIVRRGLLARAPLIGRYIRAYRRAALKHEIWSAQRILARLEGVDARRAARKARLRDAARRAAVHVSPDGLSSQPASLQSPMSS